MTPFDNGDSQRYATAVRRLTRWLWRGLAMVALVFFLAVLNNNYSLRHPSRTAINEQLDHALNDSVNWIKGHPADAETSPPLMYMVADMERMSHDPRLRAILEDYQKNYLPHPVALIDFVWYRLVIRNADVPVIQVPDQNGRMNETAWDAYAVAPDKISLAANDRANMFSATKYVWGARQHQLLALVIYRDYNGASPELDGALNYIAEKVARDERYDFRVTDSYIQRTAFVLGAGRPDLIRSQWVDRILDHQNADGSWNYCWYGWCRGVFDFSPDYKTDATRLGHSTIQAAWALTMLKYRYPQWIEEHYH